jgi:hypothetical protein
MISTEGLQIDHYVGGQPVFLVPAPINPKRLVIPRCPECGSVDSKRVGRVWKTRAGIVRYQCCCNDCGHVYTGSLHHT